MASVWEIVEKNLLTAIVSGVATATVTATVVQYAYVAPAGTEHTRQITIKTEEITKLQGEITKLQEELKKVPKAPGETTVTPPDKGADPSTDDIPLDVDKLLSFVGQEVFDDLSEQTDAMFMKNGGWVLDNQMDEFLVQFKEEITHKIDSKDYITRLGKAGVQLSDKAEQRLELKLTAMTVDRIDILDQTAKRRKRVENLSTRNISELYLKLFKNEATFWKGRVDAFRT